VRYADGGYFASQKSYQEFLETQHVELPNVTTSILLETASPYVNLSKEKMREFLGSRKPRTPNRLTLEL
jgi:hypothetical protein